MKETSFTGRFSVTTVAFVGNLKPLNFFKLLYNPPTAGIAPTKSNPVQTASSAVLSFFINLLYASRKPSVIKYDCAPVGNTAPIVDLATNGFPKDIPVKATFP